MFERGKRGLLLGDKDSVCSCGRTHGITRFCVLTSNEHHRTRGNNSLSRCEHDAKKDTSNFGAVCVSTACVCAREQAYEGGWVSSGAFKHQ